MTMTACAMHHPALAGEALGEQPHVGLRLALPARRRRPEVARHWEDTMIFNNANTLHLDLEVSTHVRMHTLPSLCMHVPPLGASYLRTDA